MLTIKDLTASKELDREAMTEIAGGMTELLREISGIAVSIGSPFNGPKFATLVGEAHSATGAQVNTNMQFDDDFNSVIGSGQVVNTGGNFNDTYQWADSYAYNNVYNNQ